MIAVFQMILIKPNIKPLTFPQGGLTDWQDKAGTQGPCEPLNIITSSVACLAQMASLGFNIAAWVNKTNEKPNAHLDLGLGLVASGFVVIASSIPKPINSLYAYNQQRMKSSMEKSLVKHEQLIRIHGNLIGDQQATVNRMRTEL